MDSVSIPWGQRVAVAVAVAIVAALVALRFQLGGTSDYSDFDQIWYAARAVLAHRDIYTATPRSLFPWPLYYPYPAAVIGVPFAVLPRLVASTVFVAIGFGLLAFAMTRRSWVPLITLASFPAYDAAQNAQWTPILTASLLMPSLAWLTVAKPTTGLVLLGTGRWTRREIVIAASIALGLVALSFVIDPLWLGRWRASIADAPHIMPAVLRPLGWLLLATIVRLGRWDARLLFGLAIVPMTFAPYDALPLALVPGSVRASLVWVTLTWLVPLFTIHAQGPSAAYLVAAQHNSVVYLACCYLPALAMVLGRPTTREVRCAALSYS